MKKTKDLSVGKMVLKSEAEVWNFISQPNAAAVCRSMYQAGEGFTSDLCNSYAWNTAIIFIQECGSDSMYYKQSGKSKIDINIPQKTGTNILAEGEGEDNNDKKCNIYDMAGNISARYEDYKNEFYERCTEEYTKEQIENIKEVRT